MEKTVSIRNANITFSIWDLGGQREFINMLPLVCNDAAAILFMFDLSRIATLNNVKEWSVFQVHDRCAEKNPLTFSFRYRQARGFNKTAVAILVGTKYDTFATFSPEEQAELTKQARRYAKAMKAPLIFSSASHSINVHKVCIPFPLVIVCDLIEWTHRFDAISLDANSFPSTDFDWSGVQDHSSSCI
jgi:GTP-binding protein of the ras superfamily involved in termination of M-phase